MSQIVSFTIGTANKVSADWQSQEAHMSVTYVAEQGETDLQKLIEEKSPELEEAHSLLWRRIREIRADKRAKAQEAGSQSGDMPGESDLPPNGDLPSNTGRRRTSRARVPVAQVEHVTQTTAQPAESAAPSTNGMPGGQTQGPLPVSHVAQSPSAQNGAGNGSPVQEVTPQTLFGERNSNGSAPGHMTAQDYVDAPSDPMMKAIQAMIRRVGYSEDDVVALLAESYGKVAVEDLNRAEAANMLGILQKLSREAPQVATAA